VAGLGGADGELNGFEVAHFADKDHIRSSRNAARRALAKLSV